MFQEEAIGILTRAGAFQRGHVVYKSGLHGDVYVDQDVIYPSTTHMLRFGGMIAELIGEWLRQHGAERLEFDTVLSPDGGAIALGQWVTYSVQHLAESRRVLCTYAEQQSDGRYSLLPRHESLIRGKGVLIVHDVLATGSTVRELHGLVAANGGRTVGVAAICNRGEVSMTDLGLDVDSEGAALTPFFVSIARIPFEAWPEDVCRHCTAGIPVRTDIGQGAAFLAERAARLTAADRADAGVSGLDASVK